MMDEKKVSEFWGKIATEPNSGCWLWTGTLNGNGYGEFYNGAGKKHLAHRISYQHYIGTIPSGKILDHTCRVRCCVNPQHLEPVTNQENVLRGALLKTHCPQGHPYSGDNLYLYKGKHRYCKTCIREHDARHQAKKRLQLAAGSESQHDTKINEAE